MENCRHFLAVLLFVTVSLAFACQAVCRTVYDRTWDNVLDRYESLCDECLLLRRKAESGEKVSTRSLTRVISDLEELRKVLRSAGGSMTPEQISRFESIRRRYTSVLSAEAPVQEPGDESGRHETVLPEDSTVKPGSVNGPSVSGVPVSPAGQGARTDNPLHADQASRTESAVPVSSAGKRPEFQCIDEVSMARSGFASVGTYPVHEVSVYPLRRHVTAAAHAVREPAMRFCLGATLAVVPDLSYGAVVAVDARNSSWGGYVKFRSNFRSVRPAYDCLSDGSSGEDKLWFSGNSAVSKIQASLGARYLPLRRLGVYAGAGYGSYVTAWEDASRIWVRVTDYCARGILLEAGLFVPLGSFELFAGISSTAFRYSDLELGAAVKF